MLYESVCEEYTRRFTYPVQLTQCKRIHTPSSDTIQSKFVMRKILMRMSQCLISFSVTDAVIDRSKGNIDTVDTLNFD